MNAISLTRLGAALRFGVISAAAILASSGQTTAQTTQINLSTQGRNVDFTAALWTRPVKTGPTLSASCSVGDLFFKTTAVPGQNLFGCTAANTWTLLGAAAVAGLGDPGSNGLVFRTGPNTTAAVTAPTGAVVGTTDSQVLTNKSIDASEIASGILSAGRLPGFSGDIVTAAGSTAAALPPVNTTPGTFGDATHSAQVTVDAKGRVTAVSQLPVSSTAGLGDPGSNGLVIRTAPNVTNSVAAPTGAIVGTPIRRFSPTRASTLPKLPAEYFPPAGCRLFLAISSRQPGPRPLRYPRSTLPQERSATRRIRLKSLSMPKAGSPLSRNSRSPPLRVSVILVLVA
ncbi:MAG TPA: hypothetical protein VK604_01095 [Bryobacteraceae bacterium]|nr:hypothetical protein [Bryobacteraceae bacterium]